MVQPERSTSSFKIPFQAPLAMSFWRAAGTPCQKRRTHEIASSDDDGVASTGNSSTSNQACTPLWLPARRYAPVLWHRRMFLLSERTIIWFTTCGEGLFSTTSAAAVAPFLCSCSGAFGPLCAILLSLARSLKVCLPVCKEHLACGHCYRNEELVSHATLVVSASLSTDC